MSWFKKKKKNIKDIEFQGVKLPESFEQVMLKRTPEFKAVVIEPSEEDEFLNMSAPFMEEAIKHLAIDIEKQKEKVIFESLQAKGIELDIEKEKISRFKSLVVEKDHLGRETWYYNNGTPEGLRLITFKLIQEGLKDMGTRLGVTFEYY